MVEDHLLPNEQLTFRLERPVIFGKSRYRAFLTGERLILFAKRGLLGRDDVVSFRLKDVGGIQYKEQGLISKQGVLQLHHANSKVDIVGPALDMKQLYQQALASTQK